jgi:GNAT superfamily N-acetyltransferase
MVHMKELKIQELSKENWKGTLLPVSYLSDYYYDIWIEKTEDGFHIPIKKKHFEATFRHLPEDGEYPDRLYEDWWENARAFGIVEDGTLLAAIEICPEEWSNRLLITELFVGEEIRGQGYGRKLIDLAKTITIQNKYRVLMLETQSSNVNAVDFYLHEGFTLIGFDTCCYTNNDIERIEVRFNMGWFPNPESD